MRTNTLQGPGSDAAVVRVKGTRRALAMAVDCNAAFCWLDPYVGAQHAVAEACRNVAASGALPIGATNNLNFGNPEKPEIMGQLVLAVRGIGAACRALDVPITGGNVSLYNETDGQAVYPTPTLAVVGVLEDAAWALRRSFVRTGDEVYLLGETRAELGGSALVKLLHGRVAGRPPAVELPAEKRLIEVMVAAAAGRLLSSAHDLSEGGLALALAESCFAGEEPGLGVEVALDALGPDLRDDLLLFAETGARMLVSTPEPARLEELCRRHGQPLFRLGRVGGERLQVTRAGRVLLEESVTGLNQAWHALERELSGGRA